MDIQSNGIIKQESNGLVINPFKVAVYVRTSTIGQANEDKISIPEQIQWAKELCEERGWDYLDKEYVDTLPGDIEFEKRPDGYRLLEDARFKLFNLILLYHSSRLAREPWVGLKTISILGRFGIQVYIRNAPIEPTPPSRYVYGSNVASEYMNAFSLVGDKQENIARGERVTIGFKNLAQRGKLTFGAYGLKKNPKIITLPDGKTEYDWDFVEDTTKAVNARRIFNDFVGGKSLRRICKDLINDNIPSPTGKTGLGSWTPATIRNILSNPALNKKVRWGRKLGSKYRQGKSNTGKQKRVFTSTEDWILQGAYNSVKIIDDRIFNQAQERLKQRGRIAGRQLASPSLLVGLVWCGDCNKRAYCKTRRAKTPKGEDYIRSDFIDSSYVRGLDCRRHLISVSKLEHLVLNKLQQRLNELQEQDIEKELTLQVDATKTMLSNSLDQLNRQIKSYEVKQSRLLDLYLGSSIQRGQFDLEKAKLDAEQTTLIKERTKMQSIVDDQKKQKEALKVLKQLLEMFVTVTDGKVKKEMVQRIIDYVMVYKDRIEIIYKYGQDPVYGLNVKPHPCGYYGDKTHECSCSASQILHYKKRVSGPILDRIDMHIEVPAVLVSKIVQDENTSESSQEIRERIIRARKRQNTRFKKTKLITNSEMKAQDIRELCTIDDEARLILKQAMTRLSLSARAFHKVIKISQTIADLEDSATVLKNHVLESLQYRPADTLLR